MEDHTTDLQIIELYAGLSRLMVSDSFFAPSSAVGCIEQDRAFQRLRLSSFWTTLNTLENIMAV